MKINKEWHEEHRMPKNPSQEQRTKWHESHTRHCSCRPMPKKLLADMKKHSIRGQRGRG